MLNKFNLANMSTPDYAYGGGALSYAGGALHMTSGINKAYLGYGVWTAYFPNLGMTYAPGDVIQWAILCKATAPVGMKFRVANAQNEASNIQFPPGDYAFFNVSTEKAWVVSTPVTANLYAPLAYAYLDKPGATVEVYALAFGDPESIDKFMHPSVMPWVIGGILGLIVVPRVIKKIKR